MERVYLCIGALAGGDESHHLVERLADMYLAWAGRAGHQARLCASRRASGHGLDWAVVELCGQGLLSGLSREAGVHGHIRIPPHDSAGRRHMSFAGVAVTWPEPPQPFANDHDWGAEVRRYVLDPPALFGPDRTLLVADPGAVLSGDLEAVWAALPLP